MRAFRRALEALAIAIAAVLGIASWSPSARAETERPNLLVVMLDDASVEHFGWNGDRVGNTPTLDQLVRSGVTFPDVHTMSRCAPSEVRFLVGAPCIDEEHNGIWTNSPPVPTPTERIWPVLLATASDSPYRVYCRGKLQFHPPSIGLDGLWDPEYWTRVDVDESLDIAAFLDDVATDPSTPWAIFLRVRTPHEPLIAPDGHVAFVEARRHLIPIPREVPLERRQAFLDDEVQRRAMLGWADSKFRKLLEMLDGRGLRRSFYLILIFTDNGRMNGRVAKGSPYRAGVNTPVTVVHFDPEKIPGSLRGTFVEGVSLDTLDLSATLLDLAGIEKPDSYTGESIRGLFEGETSAEEWRETYRDLTPGATFTILVTTPPDPSPAEDVVALYATGIRRIEGNLHLVRWCRWMKDIPDAETADALGVRHPFLPFAAWGPKVRFREELHDLTVDPLETRDLLAGPDPSGWLREIASEFRREVFAWWEVHASEPLPTR
jgi:hypothetical protein